MNEKTELKRGDIVQLDPELVCNKAFAGCMLVVTEPTSFGAQGYIQGFGEDLQPGGRAYYRAEWKEMELVGKAEWIAG